LGFAREQAKAYTKQMSYEEELLDRPVAMQIEIWKKMSPYERLQISEQLRVGAIALHSAYLCSKYPQLTDFELKQRINEFLQRGTG